MLKHAAGCTGKTANKVTYCLGEIVQANVDLKRPDGSKSNSYLDISGSLSGAGVLKQTTTGDERIFVDLKFTPAGSCPVTGRSRHPRPRLRLRCARPG